MLINKFFKHGFWLLHYGFTKKEAIRYLIAYIIQIPLAILLWIVLFVWIPSFSMLQIEGVVTDIISTSRTGRIGGYDTYYIYLKNYNHPLDLTFMKNPYPFRIGPLDLKKGDILKVYIKGRDLYKLENNFAERIPLKEYTLKELNASPNVYGLYQNGKKIVKLTRNLWNRPISLIGIFSKLLMNIFIIFCCINIGTCTNMLRGKHQS